MICQHHPQVGDFSTAAPSWSGCGGHYLKKTLLPVGRTLSTVFGCSFPLEGKKAEGVGGKSGTERGHDWKIADKEVWETRMWLDSIAQRVGIFVSCQCSSKSKIRRESLNYLTSWPVLQLSVGLPQPPAILSLAQWAMTMMGIKFIYGLTTRTPSHYNWSGWVWCWVPKLPMAETNPELPIWHHSLGTGLGLGETS